MSKNSNHAHTILQTEYTVYSTLGSTSYCLIPKITSRGPRHTHNIKVLQRVWYRPVFIALESLSELSIFGLGKQVIAT